MNSNFKLNLKVSAFCLEKLKSLIPKKDALAVSIFWKVLVGATFSTGFEESWMISNKSGSVLLLFTQVPE